MTVAELLDRILTAYPGASGEAMKTFKPVFFARLQKHEGPLLEEAANAVLGAFNPTARKPFPIPLDFELHLPTGKLDLGKPSGPTIDLAGHQRKKAELLAEWERRQKPGIAAKRGPIVASACQFTAQQVADFFAWAQNPTAIVLTAAQIEKCQERAISQERARAYGPIPEDGELYQTQWENARKAVLAGKRLKRIADREEPETMEELLDRIEERRKRADAFERDWEKGKDGRYHYRGEAA